MEERKKRKNYFSNQGKEQKRRKRLTLECGMRGFFCTCNFREKDCVREAYNILNEYADKIYGSEDKEPNSDQNDEVKSVDNKANEKEGDVVKVLQKEENNRNETEKEDQKSNDKVDIEKNESEKEKESKVEVKEDEESNEEEDISDALNKEIAELVAEGGKRPFEKKFQVVDTGVNNVIFIKTTVTDTLELAMAIIKDLNETKKQKTRYLLRMLPVQVVCKAYMDDIKSKANVLFEKYFAQEPKTYSIVFNRHNNSNLQRNEVIEDLAQIIVKKNPGNKANLKNPEIAVVVEIIKAVCLISIAPNYFTYKKYNLLEICNQKDK